MQKEELAAEKLKKKVALTSNCRAKTQGPRSREEKNSEFQRGPLVRCGAAFPDADSDAVSSFR